MGRMERCSYVRKYLHITQQSLRNSFRVHSHQETTGHLNHTTRQKKHLCKQFHVPTTEFTPSIGAIFAILHTFVVDKMPSRKGTNLHWPVETLHGYVHIATV